MFRWRCAAARERELSEAAAISLMCGQRDQAIELYARSAEAAAHAAELRARWGLA